MEHAFLGASGYLMLSSPGEFYSGVFGEFTTDTNSLAPSQSCVFVPVVLWSAFCPVVLECGCLSDVPVVPSCRAFSECVSVARPRNACLSCVPRRSGFRAGFLGDW